MFPQITMETSRAAKKPARAPWPLPFVGTTSLETTVLPFRRNHFIVFNRINFKLLGMAKMLVYGSVIVRYCDFHEMTSYDYSF